MLFTNKRFFIDWLFCMDFWNHRIGMVFCQVLLLTSSRLAVGPPLEGTQTREYRDRQWPLSGVQRHDGNFSLAWWGWGVHALHLSLCLPPRLELRCPPPPLPSKTSEITLPVLSVLPLSTSLWEGIPFDSQIPLPPSSRGYRWDQREGRWAIICERNQ
jgi:hypothetical protein